MTTPNSIAAPVTPAPQVAPAAPTLDSVASRFDIQDPPFTYTLPVPAVPAVPPAPVPGATVPAAPVPQPAAAVAPAPGQRHPTWLLASAADLGMHPVVIERLSTEELTQITMDSMKSRLAERTARSQFDAVQNPNPPGGADPAAAAAAVAAHRAAQQPQAPPAFVWGEFDDYDATGNPTGKKRPYTDDDLHPVLAHHVKELYKKLDEQGKFIQNVVAQASRSSELKFENEFDQAFNKFPAVFGQGTAAQVKDKPEFFERRRLVFGAAKGMMKSLPPELAAKMTIDHCVTSLAASMFGAAAAASPPPPPAPDYQGGTLARPTNRQPSAKPLGTARATDAVRDWWADQDANPVAQDATTSSDEFL